MRVTPSQLDELLHPIIDPKEEKEHKPMAKGLPAGPGGATGQIVFSAADAVEWRKQGKKVILVREETNPEDVEGMRAAEAILTARGGMTSHAALVARGWGKCCIVGCGALHVDYAKKEVKAGEKIFKEGDWITLNGTKGNVYEGQTADDGRLGREQDPQQFPEGLRFRQETWDPHQRRYAGRRTKGQGVRGRRHRPIQDRAYVLRQGLAMSRCLFFAR